MTNIDAVSRRTGRLLRRCQREVKARNYSALLELLDEEPFFIYHPWVERTLERFCSHPRLRRRKSGRPRHSYKSNPEAMFGLVNSLIKARRAKSRHQAFGLIEEWGLANYDTARRLYRLVDEDKTPRGVVIEYPDEAVYLAPEEVEAARASVKWLLPNSSLQSVGQDPHCGLPEVVFRGAELGRQTDDFAIITSVSLNVLGPR